MNSMKEVIEVVLKYILKTLDIRYGDSCTYLITRIADDNEIQITIHKNNQQISNMYYFERSLNGLVDCYNYLLWGKVRKI